MWHAIEDRILHVWSEHVLNGSPQHLSLHFDGLRVSTEAIQNTDEYIRACQDAISSRTSFNVKIVAKKHGSFIQLVQDEDTLVNKISTLPDLLKAEGNCIPCSVWHAIPTSRATILAALQDEGRPENVEAKRTKCRTYRSVAAVANVDLISCAGLPPDHIKNFLLHYEGNGVPHCVSVRFDMTNKVATLIDGINIYKMSLAKFQDATLAAVDRSTIISYWKRDTRDKVGAMSAVLLDMAAGASRQSHADDSDEDMGAGGAPSSGHARLSQSRRTTTKILSSLITFSALCVRRRIPFWRIWETRHLGLMEEEGVLCVPFDHLLSFVFFELMFRSTTHQRISTFIPAPSKSKLLGHSMIMQLRHRRESLTCCRRVHL